MDLFRICHDSQSLATKKKAKAYGKTFPSRNSPDCNVALDLEPVQGLLEDTDHTRTAWNDKKANEKIFRKQVPAVTSGGSRYRRTFNILKVGSQRKARATAAQVNDVSTFSSVYLDETEENSLHAKATLEGRDLLTPHTISTEDSFDMSEVEPSTIDCEIDFSSIGFKSIAEASKESEEESNIDLDDSEEETVSSELVGLAVETQPDTVVEDHSRSQDLALVPYVPTQAASDPYHSLNIQGSKPPRPPVATICRPGAFPSLLEDSTIEDADDESSPPRGSRIHKNLDYNSSLETSQCLSQSQSQLEIVLPTSSCSDDRNGSVPDFSRSVLSEISEHERNEGLASAWKRQYQVAMAKVKGLESELDRYRSRVRELERQLERSSVSHGDSSFGSMTSTTDHWSQSISSNGTRKVRNTLRHSDSSWSEHSI